MTKRNEHLFQFSGKAISDAAAAECEYHKERQKWWQEQQMIAEAALEAKGVEKRRYEISGGGIRTELIIDTTLNARANECANKVVSHRKDADIFHIHSACYGTQPERSYELHPDDVCYFRLVGGPRED